MAWPIAGRTMVSQKYNFGIKGFLRLLFSTFNFLIVASCIITLAYHSKTCIEKYLAKESRVTLTVKSSGDTTFLAFTICPRFNDAYKNVVLQKYGSSKDQIREVGNFSVMSKLSFEEVTHKFNEMMESISLTTGREDGSKIDLLESSTDKVNVVAKYSLTFGKCYSMELQPKVTVFGVTKITFVGKMGFYVYTHHPDQFFDLDTVTKVEARRGQRKYLDLAYEISENTLPEDSHITCNPGPDYNFDDCYDQTLKNELLERFGCTVPSLPPKYYVAREVCINMTAEQMKEMKDYHDHFKTLRQCTIPCKTAEVFLGALSTGDDVPNGGAYMRLYIKSTVKYKKSIYDYAFLSMIAEIGGYEGLLLGIAIVSVTGWIKKLSDRLM